MRRTSFSFLTPSTGIAVVVILTVYTGMLMTLAVRQAPTYDEPGHLVAGISNWTRGRFELYRVNPPLTRLVAAIPVLAAGCETNWERFSEAPGQRPELDLGAAFVHVNGARSLWLFTWARWACILFSLTGAVVCFLWTRVLWRSDRIAVCCLLLWCADPSLLAHGSLVTPDAASAAMGLLAAATFWCWLQHATWKWTAFAGVCLGLAQLSKMTWLILFGLWPAVWMLNLLWNRRRVLRSLPDDRTPRSRRTMAEQCVQLVCIQAIALWILNSGYGFERSGEPLGSFRFVSGALTGDMPGLVGNRFQDTWLANLPMPLPAQYVLGFDIQKRAFETEPELSYLRGEWKRGGWWYYYIYGWLVKTPHAVQLLLLSTVITLAMTCRAGHTGLVKLSGDQWMALLILCIAGGCVLILVSSQMTFNRHFRYVLPLSAFQPIVIGALLYLTAGIHRARAVIDGCVVATALSVALTFPCGLTYFNELAGGPANGYRHLNNSNYDWGQDLLRLVDWSRAASADSPLFVSCMASFDVTDVGLHCQYLDINSHSNAYRDLVEFGEGSWPDGWYAFSANHALSLDALPLVDLVRTGPGTAVLCNGQCVTFHRRLGHSIWLFSVRHLS